LLTGTLIAVTIALAILALFVTAITIRSTPLSFVVAHRCGRVVASSMPSCQPLPTTIKINIEPAGCNYWGVGKTAPIAIMVKTQLDCNRK
jgi:hypothetical protein